MDPRLKLLYFVLDIVLPLAVGYLLHRRGAFSQPRLDRLMHWNMLAVVPVLNGLAFWHAQLDPTLLWLPVFGVVMQIVPGLLGFACVGRKYDHGPERASFILASMLSNRGIVGTITVYILYQQAGFVWAQLIMLLAPIVFYLFCLPLAQFYSTPTDERARPSLAKMLFTRNQVPLIGIALGTALNVAGLSQPDAVEPMFPWLVHLMSWLFLLPVGYAMRFGRMGEYWTDLLELSAIKFLITPAIIAALAWGVGLRGEMLATVVILAAAPTAVMAVVAGRLTRINLHLTLAAFVLTTIVYLVIVFPLILLIFGRAD
ncbi:MAG: AEC family transporter [Phycisphaeraceae bacterium]